MPLVPLGHTVLSSYAPSDVQEPQRSEGLYALRVRASGVSTGRRGASEPLPLSLPARLQAGLRGDAARIPDAPAYREGEETSGEGKSQCYGGLLRGGLLQPR